MVNHALGAFYKRSLSLVELMIISVIIAIVVTILGQKFLGFDDDSKWVSVKQNIRSIEGALNLYYKDVGHYPTTEQGLQSLITNPQVVNWHGPYIAERLIVDPWGRLYRYEASNGEYIISSHGKHGLKDTQP
ncbi:type II secretion system protein GspG [Wohlfahrtiimonas chitiniclastica]|uniref:Type II secretion system protein GspG n=1 Tax=Wohlfahrtiimonas chitiniclastica TaxID=400946 RepID=A0A165HA74_9GAMM|nr:type II secretion system protein GspG [Wohlfahrtiimonas chitiniclastica]KZS23418.1 hypothetical protein BMY_1279 [Wohlfahrtiimonas chitiniclastica]KZX36971.1 Type II secretion system protein G [Wohlfahrtiimonas chitiniclastica]MBS7815326.1 type II secretion system protein GspG [Wohlfahrtiimonas chitiniclastica]MBS7817506.1 type II secretion system protein GspG [Wohlfahrtiimonas chitiniclastica]MBS7823260.1 type II secretion system protein GspG [Wohlfahrtiimonas chitiniclastica]